jgi:hypothetical protein
MLPLLLLASFPCLASAFAYLDPYSCFEGNALYWLSVSSGVRINQYGLFFFDTPVLHGDTSYPCPRIVDGLCVSGNYTFFPCVQVGRTFVDAAPEPFAHLWYDEAKCRKMPSYHWFDVMPCDLVNQDTTIIWSDGMVSVVYDTDIPYWPKMAISLILVWLVINLGESVALLLEMKGSKPQNHVTSALCLVLVGLIACNTNTSIAYVTLNERYLYWYTIAYILLYSIYHLKNPNTINVIVGCLLLVTSRVYQSAETPYVLSLLFLIVARLVQKVFMRKDKFSDEYDDIYASVRYVFMLMDMFMFISQYKVGLSNAYDDTLQAPLYATGFLFSAFCLGMSIVPGSALE